MHFMAIKEDNKIIKNIKQKTSIWTKTAKKKEKINEKTHKQRKQINIYSNLKHTPPLEP